MCWSLWETDESYELVEGLQPVVRGPIDTNTFSKMRFKIKEWFCSAQWWV
jgi:hypothetical protein